MNPREHCSDIMQNRSDLRLFVSGFSRHTTTAQVAAYFSLFGKARVEKYDSYFKRDPSRSQFKGGEGYFILSEMPAATYRSILDARPHRIQNRCLEVCPLKTGLDLIAYNHQKNQRRVLFKKVPASLEELRFLEAIRGHFGPVEHFFGYKSDNYARQTRNNSHKRSVTYSVTFQEKSSAAKAIRQGFISLRTLDGEFVATVEKFQRSGVSEQSGNQLESAIRSTRPIKQIVGIQNRTEVLSEGEIISVLDKSQRVSAKSGRSDASQDEIHEYLHQARFAEESLLISHARPANSRSAHALFHATTGCEHWYKPNSIGYQSPLSRIESSSNLMFRLAYTNKR